MLSWESTPHAPFAAGEALSSAQWDERKARKRELSAKCAANSHWKRKPVTTATETRKAARKFAQTADVCLDRLVERVEKIMRRDGGIDALLDRFDQVMPEKAPRAAVVGKS